jgi:hypothetical protein
LGRGFSGAATPCFDICVVRGIINKTCPSRNERFRLNAKSGAYWGYVSIFRRQSNAAIGQKGHFRIYTGEE